MRLFSSGCCEPLKVGVHGALGALAALCFGYNTIAFVRRGETHLAVNVVLYAALTVYEVHLVHHHREGR